MATPNKYNRGKIYKLVNDVDDEFYIGSTCETLAKRKGGHKGAANRHPNRRVYAHFNQICWGNVHIILIEQYPCENIEQLKARERHWIEELKPSLNKSIPLRSDTERSNTESTKQWKHENRNKVREYNKKYYKENKEFVKRLVMHNNKTIYKEQRNEKLKCDCGCEVSRKHFSRHTKSQQHKNWQQNQPSTA